MIVRIALIAENTAEITVGVTRPQYCFLQKIVNEFNNKPHTEYSPIIEIAEVYNI